MPARAFWSNPAGFGLPLFIIGLLILWLNHRAIVPPPFLAWTVLIWSAILAFIAEPTPAPVLLAAAAMLLRGIHLAAPQSQPGRNA
ncbi:hypothetical protein [Nocardia seriolae]|uniref:Uncharacterized protein n=1 Tax=Nocardia seriolae TaxID=37332 RepID=A0A0B8N889_9NOCA|nr:hypothetical protein [Nocardia seriolae]APA98365.1 hypothetical protein NS506_04317 [Nocardia seriolae]MTJ63037.1 hypothetical protein [Nocardia seriolae]MTJ74904.1 hypothetical protein [Nocardia seriolae]MTJ88062.1 hypothetical protein [Nocardia seriolae]MTK32052.1 hypothetical protein [Nocardia seriolae]